MALTGNPLVAEGIPDFPNYTEQEKRGQRLFFSNTEDRANCLYCHGSPAMTIPEGDNDQAKNNGLAVTYLVRDVAVAALDARNLVCGKRCPDHRCLQVVRDDHIPVNLRIRPDQRLTAA